MVPEALTNEGLEREPTAEEEPRDFADLNELLKMFDDMNPTSKGLH